MSDYPEYERTNSCTFFCEKGCSDVCCNGATLITIEEIKDFYKIFPIYIGFRKYSPLSKENRVFLKNIGGEIDDYYIIGDFVAGNRFNRSCIALDEDHLCKLQKEGKKPLQCKIVPFCAIFPEDMQDIIFAQQRQTKFAKCEGYKENWESKNTVWQNGIFTDESLKSAFYDFQRGLKGQSHFMKNILLSIYKEDYFKDFLEGEGILEMPIPAPILFSVLEEAGFSDEESLDFIISQARICQKELIENENSENTVIEDCFNELTKLINVYAEFVNKKSE